MSTFLDRLQEEQEQLLDKVTKLEDFIEKKDSVFSTVTEMQRVLLVTQLNAMKLYLYTLDERIYDLSPKTNK
jgi:uncharacterized protein YlxW (UPF0749 family)